MKILVYGINYSPELTGIGKYTGEMVEWLAAQGHEVRVITAPPYYPQWQVGENYSARAVQTGRGGRHGVALPAVRAKTAEHPETPVASRQFCRQQFLSTDGATSLEAGSHYRRGANAVLHARMRLLAKLSGARTVLHIQDYEVDAMLGLGLAGKGKGGKVAQLATAFERSGLHNVDNVSTISRSMMNKAIEKGVAAENVIFFPNWSEIARFQHVADADVDALRNQLGLPDNKNHSLLRQYW